MASVAISRNPGSEWFYAPQVKFVSTNGGQDDRRWQCEDSLRYFPTAFHSSALV
jgi:hypothetical protein